MPTDPLTPAAGRAVLWSVVIPVKELRLAKSRLASLGEDGRMQLALAFALDTVRAALDCPAVARVLVVTDDPVVAGELAGLPVQVEEDGPGAGLNAALSHGALGVRQADPQAAVAALSGDLPALRPGELARALQAAGAYPTAFVTDAAGTGTTLLTATAGHVLPTAFGPASRSAHRASGAHEIALAAVPTLRCDVDTPADLDDALRLGLGARTAVALARIRTTG